MLTSGQAFERLRPIDWGRKTPTGIGNIRRTSTVDSVLTPSSSLPPNGEPAILSSRLEGFAALLGLTMEYRVVDSCLTSLFHNRRLDLRSRLLAYQLDDNAIHPTTSESARLLASCLCLSLSDEDLDAILRRAVVSAPWRC